MPQSSFYSVNLQRAYPLKENFASPPWDDVLVDAEFIVRPSAGFRDAYHLIQLTSAGTVTAELAELLGNVFWEGHRFLAFESTAPPLVGQLMVFTVSDSAARFQEAEGVVISKMVAYAAVGNYTATENAQSDPKMWQAWSVLGNPASIPASFTKLNTPLAIEPARVKNVVEPVYTGEPGSIYVHNKNRTIYSDPPGCDHMTDRQDEVHAHPYPLVCGPIDHAVRIGGGLQVTTGGQGGGDILRLFARVGDGDLPLPCEPLPIIDGEVTRNGYGYDGSPGCEDVLRRINGVGGPDVNFVGKSGITVASYPRLNRVVVDLSSSPAGNCLSTTSLAPVEHLPIDAQGRNCGEDNQPHPDPGEPDDDSGYVASTTTGVIGGDEIDCAGSCTYQLVDGVPTVVGTGCISPCGCPDPPEVIAEGQTVILPCEEIPLTDPFNRIRNPDFVDQPPLNGWLSNAEVIYDYIGLPPSEFPMIKFSGLAMRLLEQDKIEVRRYRTYRLAADFWLLNGGTLSCKVISNSGDILLDITLDQPQYRTDFHIGYFASEEKYVTLRVVWEPGQASQAEAIFSRPAIIEA